MSRFDTLIFNSKKEFWNLATRSVQKEQFEMSSTIAYMKYPIAWKSDDAVDMIFYNKLSEALDFINKLVIDEEYLSFVRENNKMGLQPWNTLKRLTLKPSMKFLMN